MATFGRTAEGGSEIALGAAVIVCKYPLTEIGDITNISFWVKEAGGDLRGVVYSDNAGAPDVLLAQSGATTSVAGWKDMATAYDDAAIADYWIGAHLGGGGYSHGYAAGAANQYAYVGRAFVDGPPNPFGVPDGYQARELNVHADYTPSSTVSKKRMLMGVGLQARTPKFIPRKVVPFKCPLPLFP